MILHVFPDEKFIDLAIDNFENVSPSKNKYLIGINNNDNQIKHVKKHLDKVFIAPYGSKRFYLLMGNIQEYEAVVLHYLDKPKLEIIRNAPKGVNFVWNSWGGDIYNELPNWRYTLYGSETSRLIADVSSHNLFEYYLRLSFPFGLFRNIRAELKLLYLRKTIRKINFYSTVLASEKIIVEKHFRIKNNYVPFNYFSDLFNSENYKNFNINEKHSNNILLGNSAAPTNNHMEAINLLMKFNLIERKVILPLSYGANPKYINKIKEHGQKALGKNFVPLDLMLPINKYFNLISSCSVCIMNHYRQNGMGNVIFMIWLGAKVFLSEKNPAYSFLKGLGLVIYSIEIDLATKNSIAVFDSLPDADKLNNKRIIEEQYGYEVILQRITNFVNVITGKTNLLNI